MQLKDLKVGSKYIKKPPFEPLVVIISEISDNYVVHRPDKNYNNNDKKDFLFSTKDRLKEFLEVFTILNEQRIKIGEFYSKEYE